jgi:hypothetical protein
LSADDYRVEDSRGRKSACVKSSGSNLPLALAAPVDRLWPIAGSVSAGVKD